VAHLVSGFLTNDVYFDFDLSINTASMVNTAVASLKSKEQLPFFKFSFDNVINFLIHLKVGFYILEFY
jgi:hypothetical protein